MSHVLRLATAPIRFLFFTLLRAFPESVSGPIVFEMKSFVGRLFARRLRVDPRMKNYMNLGSADDRLDGYVAVDFFSSRAGYGADLRYPLLIDDAVFDGIFTEHTLEHLNYKEVAGVLSECRRTLKPGGIIRIIVPDLSLFVENYASDNRSWFQDWEREVLKPRGRSMVSPMEALSFETQEHGHRSAWDFETMKAFLTRAGFTEICRCAFGKGSDARLLQDKDAEDRTMVSLYVEARKPTIPAEIAPTAGKLT
jgi:predicted SAM-dependent methyltransferase